MAITAELQGADYDVAAVTILSGASLSGIAEIGAGEIIAIVVPTFTSAAVTFSVSADGVTFYDLYDNASSPAEVSYAAATHNKAYQRKDALRGWPFIKVRSGTSGTPVNQGADRVVQLLIQAVR